MRKSLIEWANSKHNSDRQAELEWESILFEGVILLSFSVYSAHSHYEIFHNVEALRGNRMESSGSN